MHAATLLHTVSLERVHRRGGGREARVDHTQDKERTTLLAMCASSLSFSVLHRQSVGHIVLHSNFDIRRRVFHRARRSPASLSVWFAGGSWRSVGTPSTSPVPFRAGSEVDERIDRARIILVCLPGPVAAQALRTHRFRRAPLPRLLLVPLPLAPGQVIVLAPYPRSSETSSMGKASNGRTWSAGLGRRLSAEIRRSRPYRSASQTTCRNQPISSTPGTSREPPQG